MQKNFLNIKATIILVLFSIGTIASDVKISLKGDWPEPTTVKLLSWKYFDGQYINGSQNINSWSYMLPDSIRSGIVIAQLFENENVIFEKRIVWNGVDVNLVLESKEMKVNILWKGSSPNQSYEEYRGKIDSLQNRLAVLRELCAVYPEHNSEFYKKSIQEMENNKEALFVFSNQSNEKYAGTALGEIISSYYLNIPDFNLDPAIQTASILDKFFSEYNPLSITVINSPIYKEKLDEYMELAMRESQSVTGMNEKQIIYRIDQFLNKVIDNEVLFNLTVDYIWDNIYSMSLDDVIMHLDLNYKLDQCQAGDDIALQDRLEAYKRLAVGSPAPEIKWVEGNTTKSLVDYNTDIYVIIFWASWCTHCASILPDIHAYLADNDATVIAIGIDESEKDWKDITEKYPQWNHLRAKEKWNSKWVVDYAIYATPTFYILDAKRNIIGKEKDLDGLRKYFN